MLEPSNDRDRPSELRLVYKDESSAKLIEIGRFRTGAQFEFKNAAGDWGAQWPPPLGERIAIPTAIRLREPIAARADGLIIDVAGAPLARVGDERLYLFIPQVQVLPRVFVPL